MKLPFQKGKSRMDRAFDALGAAGKATAAWQVARGGKGAKAARTYTKAKVAGKGVKGAGGLLKRLPVVAGVGALAYAISKKARSEDSGFADPSWQSSGGGAGTESGGAATAATGTPPVDEQPHAAGGVDVPPAVAASGGETPGAPATAAGGTPADSDALTEEPSSTETNPTEPELGVEAPNESAPGHHPSEDDKS